MFSNYCFTSAHMLKSLYNLNSYQLRILLDKPLGHELEVEWLGAAVSPTDTSGKDSTLPLVTSENPFPL